MKKTISILISLVSVCALVCLMPFSPKVQASGNESSKTAPALATKTISIGKFNAVDAELSIEVRVKIGKASGKATIMAREDVLEYIECDVNGGTLEVGLSSNLPRHFRMGKVIVEVSTPSLEGVYAETSSIIQVNGDLSFEEFEAETETSGKIILGALDGNKVSFNVETSGNITCGNVKCVDFETDAETSASVNINALECSNVEINVETSAKVMISAGAAQSCDLSADTNGLISIAGMSIGEGDAEAETGGKIIATINNPSVSTETGGRVKLN